MTAPNTSGFNPYAAPSVDSGFAPGPQLGHVVGSHYALSVTKLWVMSILSFGLYNLAFFYRHWAHLRDHHQQDVSPFWRAVFSPFTYFGFNSQVSDTANFRQVPLPAMMSAAPIVFFMASVVGRALDRMTDVTNLWASVATLATIPIGTYCLTVTQTAVNRILEQEGYTGPVNNGVTAGSVVVGILGGLLWALSLLGIASVQ